MASFPENPQTWVPYEPTKDCSLGLCSIYCPQWCYIYFSPPPPSSFSDDSSGSETVSPLVVAILAVLAVIFILISYYTIFSKNFGVFSSFRRGLGSSGARIGGRRRSNWHDDWHGIPANGLDESVISMITVRKYRKGDELVDSTDCSVCLTEFGDEESLRVLPNCSHAFHVKCIDTWLKCHSNCPLCRANIVPVMNLVPPQETSDSAASQTECSVVEIEDDNPCEQKIRRSFSLDSSQWGKVSVADVLHMSMEDAVMEAKEHGVCSSSSREFSREGNRDRGLNGGVLGPLQMKRSMSNGRFFLTRQGRGKDAVFPV